MTLANFSFSLSGLSLTLTDISGPVTSRLWEIFVGDDLIFSDTDLEYSQELEDNKLYRVKLTVTIDGEVYSSRVNLITESEEGFLYQTINQILLSLIPEGITFNETQVWDSKLKWQILLAHGLNIPKEHTHNELRWPYLANLLIGYLLVRDLVTQSINKIMLSLGTGGTVKSITTGPTEVEYQGYERALSQLLGEGGALELLQNQICAIAQRLDIHITGCEDVSVMPFRIVYNSDRSYEHKYIRTPEFISKI